MVCSEVFKALFSSNCFIAQILNNLCLLCTPLLGEPLPAHLEKVRKAIQSLPQKSGAVVKPAKQV